MSANDPVAVFSHITVAEVGGSECLRDDLDFTIDLVFDTPTGMSARRSSSLTPALDAHGLDSRRPDGCSRSVELLWQWHAELAGRLALGTLVGLLIVKLVIWSVALGSNTSGGILAPLLMLGAALGGILGSVLPGASDGTWALLRMAGALAGVTRSPLTSIVFALELTQRAHTQAVDPLHALLVRDVMATDVLTVAPATVVAGLYEQLPDGSINRRQRLYPVLKPNGRLQGVLALSDIRSAREAHNNRPTCELAREPLTAQPVNYRPPTTTSCSRSAQSCATFCAGANTPPTTPE